MLTNKKKLFCEEYIISLNGTEAARKAGYKSKDKTYLPMVANRLLREKEVKDYINKRLESKTKDLIATQDEVLQYLSSCIRGKAKETKCFVLRKTIDDKFKDELIIKKLDIKVRDRLKACEIMAKIYKLMDEPPKPQVKYVFHNVRRNKTNE